MGEYLQIVLFIFIKATRYGHWDYHVCVFVIIERSYLYMVITWPVIVVTLMQRLLSDNEAVSCRCT